MIIAQKVHFLCTLLHKECTFVIIAQKKIKFQIRENGITSISQKLLRVSSCKLHWIEEREKDFLARCITKNH